MGLGLLQRRTRASVRTNPSCALFASSALKPFAHGCQIVTLNKGRLEIFNTDQGIQFTGDDFIDVLRVHGIAISMDGHGRFSDKIFVERVWRSLKYRRGIPQGLPERGQGTS
jgi:hypothetical protein